MTMRAPLRRGGVLAASAIASTTLLHACAPTDDTRTAANIAGPLIVREAWARPADSGTTAGAYLTLHNVDTTAHVITTITSPDAASAELHATMQHDGMVHMVAQPRLTIPRDSTLVMLPGGLHVMLHATTRTLTAGDTVRLVLTLDQGTVLPVAVVVRAP